MKASFVIACLLGLASTQQPVVLEMPQGLPPACIADFKALIPAFEKILSLLEAGDYSTAIDDLMVLPYEFVKIYSDCGGPAVSNLKMKLEDYNEFLASIKVGDLPTCIADLEAMIPGVEKIIADFKSGDYNTALTDALTLLPEAEKAYTDCTASTKSLGERFKTILKDDPRREYFEKQGAQFAEGFLVGTKVYHFDSIDLYECLHREPTAVETFYKADEEAKYALIKKEYQDAVKAMDEMIHFVVEMIKEDYPHSRTSVCKALQVEGPHWEDLVAIIKDLDNQETTLQVTDDHFFFNKQDITSDVQDIAKKYVESNFAAIGYDLGQTLLKASQANSNGLFLY